MGTGMTRLEYFKPKPGKLASVKSQRVSILGFAGHMISTIVFIKAALNNT